MLLTTDFGERHFLWWFGTPVDEKTLELIGYNSRHVNLNDSDDCLFVVIVRDPYEWLRSFYYAPHHVHKDLLYHGFFHFLSHTWHPVDIDGFERRAFNLIDEFNPFLGRPFKNVLELRTYKTQNYLKMGTMVKNYLIVRYEDVAKNPEEFIQFVSAYYNLKTSSKFIPINSYKGLNKKPYKQKKYFSIKDKSLRFINENLDWETENQLGYFENKVEEKSKIYLFFKKLERKIRKFFRRDEKV